MNLPAAQYASFKTDGKSCTSCVEGLVRPVFKASHVSIVCKGDVWVDKNLKERAYREARSDYLKVKQKESNFVPTLQPNYDGMEVDTWRDAQHLASQGGKDAASYQSLVVGGAKP